MTNLLDLREPVSAATHGAAFLAAIPAAFALYRRADPRCTRRWVLVLYGLGLSACFAASTACHALMAFGVYSTMAVVADHIGIYLLIAGTYTPIAGMLLPPEKRGTTLKAVWGATAVGAILNLAGGPLPAWLATSFYLAMGWGGLWCYASLRPGFSHAQLALMPTGGILYSVGAVFHVVHEPVVWPGVFGAHELFHVLVVAGAASHFLFIWNHVPTVDRCEERGSASLTPGPTTA